MDSRQVHSRDPKLQIFLGGKRNAPRPPCKGVLLHESSYYHQNFHADNLLLCSLCTDWISPALHFPWPQLKCFSHSDSHLSFPNRSLAPEPPVSEWQRTFSSYWSFSSRRQRSKMHAIRSSRSAIYGYSRCVICVWVCMSEHVSTCVWIECMQTLLTGA